MVKTISEHYVALTETENAKLSRLLTPEYLRSVLRKPNDNLKIEYCSGRRTLPGPDHHPGRVARGRHGL